MGAKNLKKELQALDQESLVSALANKNGQFVEGLTSPLEFADSFIRDYPAFGRLVLNYVEDGMANGDEAKLFLAAGAALAYLALVEVAEHPELI